MKNFNLENRLVKFSSGVIRLLNLDHDTLTEHILAKQLIRSASSSALNSGEAQRAESQKDFVHKLKIVTKELSETHVGLQIMKSAELSVNSNA